MSFLCQDTQTNGAQEMFSLSHVFTHLKESNRHVCFLTHFHDFHVIGEQQKEITTWSVLPVVILTIQVTPRSLGLLEDTMIVTLSLSLPLSRSSNLTSPEP